MAGVAGLVVLGGAGTALLGGQRAGIQGAGSAARPEVPSTTAPTLAPAPTPSLAAPETTSTTAAPTTAPPTTAPATTVPVLQPGPLTAPKVGAYVYDVISGGVTRKGDANSTIEVRSLPHEGATAVRTVQVPPYLTPEQGTVVSTVAWGQAGATERASNMVPRGVWQAPWLRYVKDLAVGRSWSYDTHLRGTMEPFPGDPGPGITFDFHLRGRRQVTGTQTVTVAGRQVPTWTIEIDETLVMPLVGVTRTLRTNATEQLAPSIGLPVTRREVVTGGQERMERNVELGQLPS